MISNFLNPHHFPILLFIVTILHRVTLDSVSASCQLSFKSKNKLYNYNLASPIPNFPHGILSEDGFYKVAANETVLWFQIGFISFIFNVMEQLCNEMIFNHDPPYCVECKDCGSSPRCGMECSALMGQNIGGYPVCTTIGHPSSTTTELIDVRKPQAGIVVTMSNSASAQNCSVKVSVICDSKQFQGPQTIQKTGACDYVTQLKHPSGCANIRSSRGNGWGWFGSLIMIILCLFGAYLLAGGLYRHFHLGIHGIDVIPNLEFWASLPHRVQSFIMSTIRRYRGPSEGYRTSYSPVNF